MCVCVRARALFGATVSGGPSDVLFVVVPLPVFLSAELEARFTSLQRLEEYAAEPSEAPLVIPDHRPPAGWPSKGHVAISNLVVQYASSDTPSLMDVTVDIPAGSHVSLVGRSGSGKSTLTAALFRIVEPADGAITIDGVDLAQLGLEYRAMLSIIPQSPFLIAGTLRDNIDPFRGHTDAQVLDAMDRVQLTAAVPDATLSFHVTTGGSNLSVGSRQLVCLARALLKQAKVLCLDEASSALDLRTDTFIQQALATAFRNTTVLSITHRLHSVVEQAEKVVVLDGGRVLETGSPLELLGEARHALDGGAGGKEEHVSAGAAAATAAAAAAAALEAKALPSNAPRVGSFRAFVLATGATTSRRLHRTAVQASSRRLLLQQQRHVDESDVRAV